ncbi:MAG: MmcQ/YjbR family DNA-binding protein [Arcicella sp.]|nr:MmcQ/YjbR family DNA-binding protein [Arcicella sp.]
MNIEEFRDFCIAKKRATEELPFGPDVLVYKVLGKIFALTSLNTELFSTSLKCNPDKAVELREEYDYIVPGYHLNKKHWNTINCEIASTVLMKELINHSFDTVVASFTKKQKEEFDLL